MTKQEAIKNSIVHWERMIRWVSEQPSGNISNTCLMEQEIGESWTDVDCSLCQQYLLEREGCSVCPLGIKYGYCGDFLENAWDKVDNSQTWGDWLIHAKVMLKQLRSLR